MCNTFAVYFQIFKTFGYKKLKNSDNHCDSSEISNSQSKVSIQNFGNVQKFWVETLFGRLSGRFALRSFNSLGGALGRVNALRNPLKKKHRVQKIKIPEFW